jgi:hypothetical protein
MKMLNRNRVSPSCRSAHRARVSAPGDSVCSCSADGLSHQRRPAASEFRGFIVVSAVIGSSGGSGTARAEERRMN